MALLNIDTVIREALRNLKETTIGGGVEIMSYKRNRTVAIIVDENGFFTVREKGYEECEVTLQFDALPKDLKKRIKREFPRSRKLRLVKFTDAAELERIHQKI